jgi:hypothetical protein
VLIASVEPCVNDLGERAGHSLKNALGSDISTLSSSVHRTVRGKKDVSSSIDIDIDSVDSLDDL